MQWLERLAFTASHQAMQRHLLAGRPLTVADTHHIVARMLAGKPERVEPSAITTNRMARVVFAKRHRKEHVVDAALIEIYGVAQSKRLLPALGPEGPGLIAMRMLHLIELLGERVDEIMLSTPHLARRVREILRIVLESFEDSIRLLILASLSERRRAALVPHLEIHASLPAPAKFGFIDYFIRGARQRMPVQFFDSVLGAVGSIAGATHDDPLLTMVDDGMSPVVVGGFDAVLALYPNEMHALCAWREFEPRFSGGSICILDLFRMLNVMQSRNIEPGQAYTMVNEIEEAIVASDAVARRDMERFFDQYPDLTLASHLAVPAPDPLLRVFHFTPA